jgi:hypothetical protein
MTPAHGCMVFEAILTNHVHQRWKSRNVNYRSSSKRIQRIIGEFSFADVGSNLAARIVRTDSSEG